MSAVTTEERIDRVRRLLRDRRIAIVAREARLGRVTVWRIREGHTLPTERTLKRLEVYFANQNR